MGTEKIASVEPSNSRSDSVHVPSKTFNQHTHITPDYKLLKLIRERGANRPLNHTQKSTAAKRLRHSGDEKTRNSFVADRRKRETCPHTTQEKALATEYREYPIAISRCSISLCSKTARQLWKVCPIPIIAPPGPPGSELIPPIPHRSLCFHRL